jgi:hypothetical protein
MSARLLPDLLFGLRLALAFSAWNLLAIPLLPMYAQLVVPFARWGLEALGPHDTQVLFTDVYPYVKWHFYNPAQMREESVSFRLLSYNLILYLSLLTVLRSVPLWHRAILLLSGLPVLFVFHGVDLLLVVESKYLTWAQPQHYAFWDEFSLWFVVVKFYHSFSVLVLKQIFPLLLLWLQWQGLRRSVKQDEN